MDKFCGSFNENLSHWGIWPIPSRQDIVSSKHKWLLSYFEQHKCSSSHLNGFGLAHRYLKISAGKSASLDTTTGKRTVGFFCLFFFVLLFCFWVIWPFKYKLWREFGCKNFNWINKWTGCMGTLLSHCISLSESLVSSHSVSSPAAFVDKRHWAWAGSLFCVMLCIIFNHIAALIYSQL